MSLSHISPALTLAVLAQLATPDPLIGRWDAEIRSHGGIGTSITIAEGGLCTKTIGAMVDSRWTFADGRLTRSIETADGRPGTEVIPVRIEGDTMTLSMDGGQHTMQRIGASGRAGHPVEGLWSYPHPAGGTAYEDYEPDGRFLFRLPMVAQPCSWTVNGNGLRLIFNGVASDFSWEVSNGRLILQESGERSTFHRETTVLPAPKKP